MPQDGDIPYYAKPLFQHDVLVGVRHAFNDEASRALTIVGIVDVVRPQEFFINAGYAQRLGETWSVQAGRAHRARAAARSRLPARLRVAEQQPPRLRKPVPPLLIATRKERLP